MLNPFRRVTSTLLVNVHGHAVSRRMPHDPFICCLVGMKVLKQATEKNKLAGNVTWHLSQTPSNVVSSGHMTVYQTSSHDLMLTGVGSHYGVSKRATSFVMLCLASQHKCKCSVLLWIGDMHVCLTALLASLQAPCGITTQATRGRCPGKDHQTS